MAKRFDATTKQLIDAYPADWLAFAGLPAGAPVQVVDADLSSFTLAADKVIRVGGPDPYVGHVELQSGPDARLDRRVHVYNAVIGSRHNLPVRSVVFLLRPEALSPANAGRVQDLVDPHCRLDFSYRLVRVWEVSPESVLSGGLGTLPLASLTGVARPELPDVLRRVAARLERELPVARADELWTATYILSGLRHPPDEVEPVMSGVRQMKESATYQAILAEGRAEGKRDVLIDLGTERFGPPDAATRNALERMADANLARLTGRLLHASSWKELLEGE